MICFLSSLGGTEQESEKGRFWLRRKLYPTNQLLHSPDDIDGSALSWLSRDVSLGSLNPQEIAFIDTETTGLAGGTGTYPFLVGIGRFTEDGFLVTQYLMRDYDEEPAMLEALSADLRLSSVLATYNGKCFDAPPTRYALSYESPSSDIRFYTAFRFVTSRPEIMALPLRALYSYELGIAPSQTNPGDRYSRFPKSRRSFLILFAVCGSTGCVPFSKHNAVDIYSLAMLTAKACRLFRNPQQEVEHPLDWFGLGRSFLANKEMQMARLCFEKSLQCDLPEAFRWIAMRDYSRILKRARDYEEAACVWRDMLAQHNSFSSISL